MGRTWRIRNRGRKNPVSKGIYPDTSQVVIDFLRWSKSHGFKYPKSLKICKFGPAGRGILLKNHGIRERQCIMSCPLGTIILPSTLRKTDPLLYSHFTDDVECLMVFLSVELSALRQNVQTDWTPYIRMLPQKYDDTIPFLTADAEIRYLDPNAKIPESFAQTIQQQLDDLKQHCGAIQKIVQLHSLNVDISPKALRWAIAVINTRCVIPSNKLFPDQVQDEAALIPLFDMMNHDINCFSLVETSNESGFRLIAESSYKRYTQLCINYNPKLDNRNFYVFYGFSSILDPKNHDDQNRSLRVFPSPNDMLRFSQPLLVELLERMTKKDERYHKLGQQIASRFEFMINQNFFGEEEEYHILWPAYFFHVQNEPIAVKFWNDDSTGNLKFSHENHQSRLLDLTVPEGTFITSFSAIQHVFKFLACSNWDAIQSYIVDLTFDEQIYKLMTLDSEKEKCDYWTLMLLLVKGLLYYDYGFDTKGKLTIESVKEYLNTIQDSVNEEPLVRIFGNEIGMLMYYRSMIEAELT